MALRIKSDVDLKELEKYGFEIADEPNKDVVYIKYDGDNAIYFYNDKEMYFEIQEYSEEIVNILYDLIKADLVEKID